MFSDDDDIIYIISPSQVDSGSSFAASMRSPMGGTRDPSRMWSFLVAEVAGPPLNCVALSVALVVWVGPRVALFERL